MTRIRIAGIVLFLTMMSILVVSLIMTTLPTAAPAEEPEKSSSPTSTSAPQETSSGEVSLSPEASLDQEIFGGEYIEYEEGVLAEYENRKRVLFFYANWCPTCRPVDQELRANEGLLPRDVVVIRVNYNDDQTDNDDRSLAREYGITYQHTFVEIDENGDEVQTWNGGDLRDLLQRI